MTRDPEGLAVYFDQGFIPREDHALAVIAELVGWAEEYRDQVAGQGFEDIMIAELAGKGPCALALSGGQDSRFILAILNEAIPQQDISCFTWGPAFSADVQGAKAITRKMKYPHTVLDTRRVEWDLAAVTAYLDHVRPGIGMTAPRLDAVWLFHQLGQGMPHGALRLNGFLGDMLSGAHLAHARGSTDETCAALARMNRYGVAPSFDAEEYYRTFCARNAAFLQHALARTEFCLFDLLDYAFRQKQRIGPVMLVDGRAWASPFDTPLIIAKWALTPIEKRQHQALYRQSLHRILGADQPAKRSLFNRISGRVRRMVDKKPVAMRNLADPLRNRSLRQAMGMSCAALDERNLVERRFSPGFERLLERPNAIDWTGSLQAMSLELHLRSGLCLQDQIPLLEKRIA